MAEYFRDHQAFLDILESCTTEEFLGNVCRKYHFTEEQKGELAQMACRMKAPMMEEAAFSLKWKEKAGERQPMAQTVMTLGAGVDVLQQSYADEGKLSECYMIEVLGSELLLKAYGEYNHYVADTTEYHVAGYLFLESGREAEGLGLEAMEQILADSGLDVSCNSAYCILPKKSVVFYARLTKDASAVCPGICRGCGNRECGSRNQEKRLLPYGYARILGRELL